MDDKYLASEWMKANGHSWRHKAQRPSIPNGFLKKKDAPKSTEQIRRIRMGQSHVPSIAEFVRSVRGCDQDECLFVPGAQKDAPARVKYLGRTISAARYMALLTLGAPNHEGMFARHLCGNGHLSCVNPKHIVWGTPGDNWADANKHRAAERRGKSKISVFEDDL